MPGNIKTEYFKWLYNMVSDDKSSVSYKKLFKLLHVIDFSWILPLDENRAKDGEYLRYTFVSEKGYPESYANSYLDRPCSVLEMMVALACRCEDEIMYDESYGDRRGQWFWSMILCLGLNSMNDDNFDADYVRETIDIFLNREYGRDGKGGLFQINNRKEDMRNVEIWYQMNFYLSEFLNE